MLRLNFRTVKGDSPTLMLASSIRFCADGTLRASDNYVVARCVEGCWQVGGRLHRELDCEGPVRVRVTTGFNEPAVHFGPFAHVRTARGMLYGDDAPLNILMPGRTPAGTSGHELTLLSVGGPDGKA
jgi:hypothetical protein